MSDIKLGVIGAGHIAREHLNVIQEMANVKVVGITSRTISKAENIAKSCAIENVYANLDLLIKKCYLDGLLVLVSADQIFEVTKRIIPTKIPIFLEKPPGLFPEQTKFLVKLTEKHGTNTFVGFNRRYYSIYHKGLNVIKEHGRLLGVSVEGHERFWKITEEDHPENIRENWIYANSTHTIDLLRFFGGEIKSINTLTNKLKEKNGDQFVASIEYDSGALGTYTSHWYSPGGWSVKLYGEGVTVKFKPLEKGFWTDSNFESHDINVDNADIKYKPGFFKQMEAYIKMIKTGKLDWPGMDLFDALKTMKLAEKYIYG
jgi:predicted dehydrogenase